MEFQPRYTRPKIRPEGTDLYVLGGKILSEDPAISRVVSDRMFVYIDEIDEGDDPDDVSCWGKANPSLGKLLILDDLIAEWERCKLVPAERADWINKQLNVFTMIDELSFLDAPTILKNNGQIDPAALEGARCYGGFDLSEVEDFTSACLEFPLGDNRFFLLEHSWVPIRKVKENREKLDWALLQASGWLTVCEAEYVEFERVLEWFEQMQKAYLIDAVGYDPAKAFQLVQAMISKGFVMDVVRQGEHAAACAAANFRACVPHLEFQPRYTRPKMRPEGTARWTI